ncbi:unnamed protein product [Urochloa humidicola]
MEKKGMSSYITSAATSVTRRGAASMDALRESMDPQSIASAATASIDALRERMDPQGLSSALRSAASRATTSMHALRDLMRIDPLDIFMR